MLNIVGVLIVQKTFLELLLNNWAWLIYHHKTWLEMPRPSGDESNPAERDPLIAKFSAVAIF